MTTDEILSLAKQAGGTPYTNRHTPGETAMAFGPAALLVFANLIIDQERERCAKIVERALYPLPHSNYQDQYNAGIRALAEKIRSGT